MTRSGEIRQAESLTRTLRAAAEQHTRFGEIEAAKEDSDHADWWDQRIAMWKEQQDAERSVA